MSISGEQGNSSHTPRLVWDWGSGYELFISLYVLHHPDNFGLRPSWAAGVRSRLSPEDRKTLEDADIVLRIPYHWLHRLPDPKDSSSVLWNLRQIPAPQRLPVLGLDPDVQPPIVELLQSTASRGSWKPADPEMLKKLVCDANSGHSKWTDKDYGTILDAWAAAADFGERYLQALQAYQQAFFAEEEARISSALRAGLERAQVISQHSSVLELIETLSQGVSAQDWLGSEELILVPSYWSTPLIFYGKVSSTQQVVVFGARPETDSLVPGEIVPDAILRALKALADPTRLRILHYLTQEPMTPSELARRLRLRAPTVTHHLSALRLAGLVHLNLEGGAERHYTARMEMIQGLSHQIEVFLKSDDRIE